MAKVDSILIDCTVAVGDETKFNGDENQPLLPDSKRMPCWRLFTLRYRATRKCVSSKAALLMLLWNFAVVLVSGYVLTPSDTILFEKMYNFTMFEFNAFYYSVVTIVFLLFPLAGCLADIKCGRFKVIMNSSLIILISLIFLGIVIPIFWVLVLTDNDYFYSSIVLSLLIVILTIPLCVGLTGFTANILQFGMDQLYDSPGEDRSLFIHWYVWVYYASLSLVQLAMNLNVFSRLTIYWEEPQIEFPIIQLVVGIAVIFVVLSVVLCLVKYKRRWFLIDPGITNPYRLVYRVTKFACQHKTPVRRSAFTYCEDELPTGLDLGKEKYGGCFTTEEVEDVKAFYGILRVLVSFGAVFFLDFAASFVLPWQLNMRYYYDEETHKIQNVLLNTGLISSLIVTLALPLYLYGIRPFVSLCIPGMLKRMGIGMLVHLLPFVTILPVNFVTDSEYTHNATNLTTGVCILVNNEKAVSLVFLIQQILSALAQMLVYIGAYEFICSQSPHSMKGMLIGLLYAIKGTYQLLGLIAAIPFNWPTFAKSLYPHCGIYYTVMNISVGSVALFVYVFIARRYQYRKRDEPSKIHQYAEEYYSNSN